MLVLSRKRDESIMVGNDVTITIVDIRDGKVRIGIEAPNDVPVHRREIYDVIKREEQLAKDGKLGGLPSPQEEENPPQVQD